MYTLTGEVSIVVTAQVSSCIMPWWLLVPLFFSVWTITAAVPLPRDTEEVNQEMLTLIENIRAVRQMRKLEDALQTHEIKTPGRTGEDIADSEFGEMVEFEGDSPETSCIECGEDIFENNERDLESKHDQVQTVNDTDLDDRLVGQLLIASDSTEVPSPNSIVGKGDAGAVDNTIGLGRRQLNIQDMSVDIELNKGTVIKIEDENSPAGSKSGGKVRIAENTIADIDDIIRLLRAYENVSTNERVESGNILSENSNGDDGHSVERIGSSGVLANIRLELGVLLQSDGSDKEATTTTTTTTKTSTPSTKTTTTKSTTTTTDMDPCLSFLGVRDPATNSGPRNPGHDNPRLEALEVSFKVDLLDNGVYHFERIEPGVTVTFKGELLTRPMSFEEMVSHRCS